MKMRLWLALSGTSLLLLFQNCSKVAFSTSSPVITASSLSTDDTLIETNMNTPVEFEVRHSIATSGLQIHFASQNGGNDFKGEFLLLSADTFQVRYTPGWGFRGRDHAVAIVRDKYGNDLKFNITVIVGNSLQSLQPALAVRGMGCIQCHAQLGSNVVTDFGYKNDYYFGLKPSEDWWKSGGVYGDHGNSFNTVSLPADKSVIVPKADLPAVVAASAPGLATLADYIKSQFAQSTIPSTQAAQVIEKSSVYIGAPTAADLSAAFKISSGERMKYFKNSDDAAELSGLKDEGDFFTNEGILNCEGDLALHGPLLLRNLQINSKTGCRIYVTGSVFLYGAITYTNSDDDRNLQITSTKSISLGLGTTLRNGTPCDPTDRYALHPASYGTSSLTNRYVSFWTVPGNYVRQSSDPKAFGQTILDEADLIQAKAGPLFDATCGVEGRNISFERILLNAPIVHSRYQGNVTGTIIAEFSVMSLGVFKFSFDSVFSRVPVFPFLDKSQYLDVKN